MDRQHTWLIGDSAIWLERMSISADRKALAFKETGVEDLACLFANHSIGYHLRAIKRKRHVALMQRRYRRKTTPWLHRAQPMDWGDDLLMAILWEARRANWAQGLD